jgi:hypothetical protein
MQLKIFIVELKCGISFCAGKNQMKSMTKCRDHIQALTSLRETKKIEETISKTTGSS